MEVRVVAALVVVAVLAAGCFGKGGGDGGEDEGNGDGSGTSGGPGAAPDPAPAGPLSVRFSWDPPYPRAGESAVFTAQAQGLGGAKVSSWSWDWGDGTQGNGATAAHAFGEPGEWRVTLRATTSDGRTPSAARTVFVLGVGEPAPAGNATGNATGPPPPPPGVFECPGGPVVEPFDTHGTDDTLPNLAWASLKTGFRLAVAWTSEQPATGSLTYSIGNATPRTVAEAAPTRAHLLVLDNVPEGRTVCFTALMGGVSTPQHAVRAANAMTAFQPGAPHGAYTANFLALANEGADLAEVTAGMERYAAMLWDATDGWVRAGAVLVVANDPVHHNAGWATCYVVRLGPPACHNVYDVVFTEDAVPQGAASTIRKGVRDPDAAIWMNMHWQAVPGPVSADDAGAVLTHEAGHYLFDMADQYGDPVVPDSTECTDAGLSISIMGGSRDVTEFDDELHPCEGQGSGYVPSWTLMRGEFPEIPFRHEIDPGPSGDGGVFLQRLYRGV